MVRDRVPAFACAKKVTRRHDNSNMTDITSWLLATLALVGLGSLVVLFQDCFIYFPVRYSTAQLEAARTLGVQEIRFRTSQGSQVAFFCSAFETVPQRIWLVFGGNGASF
jgi:hypothetical protein